MSGHAIRRMAAAEFLEWGLDQELRHELVDGVPVAMAGAKRRHDRIVSNLHGLLFNALRGRHCQSFTADTGVRIPSGNICRPAAGIDCGDVIDDSTTADAPFLVIEVLSPSTRTFDMVRRLNEYQSVPSLCHIVMIDPDHPEAIHWSRAPGQSWVSRTIQGLDARITISDPPCDLDLATIHEGLTFPDRPRLVLEAP